MCIRDRTSCPSPVPSSAPSTALKTRFEQQVNTDSTCSRRTRCPSYKEEDVPRSTSPLGKACTRFPRLPPSRRRRPGLQTVIATRWRIPPPAATDKMPVVQMTLLPVPATFAYPPSSRPMGRPLALSGPMRSAPRCRISWPARPSPPAWGETKMPRFHPHSLEPPLRRRVFSSCLLPTRSLTSALTTSLGPRVARRRVWRTTTPRNG